MLKKELRESIRLLIICSIVIVIFIASGLYKYTGFESSGIDVSAFMDSMPKMILAVFGFSSLNLNEVLGFYGIIFQYMVLMGGFFAAHIGFNTLVKEERDRTTEFLMVKPISRRKILIQKLGANILEILIFVLVCFVASIIGLKLIAAQENLFKIIVNLHLGLFMVELFLMIIGMSIAAISRNKNRVSQIAMGMVFLFYIISILIDFNESFEIMTILCPLKYFNTAYLIEGQGLSLMYSSITLVGSWILSAISIPIYEKRDLNI